MLPTPLIDHLRRQYKYASDLASAQGAADQIGMREEFNRRMSEDASDPWQVIRDLCRYPVPDQNSTVTQQEPMI